MRLLRLGAGPLQFEAAVVLGNVHAGTAVSVEIECSMSSAVWALAGPVSACTLPFETAVVLQMRHVMNPCVSGVLTEHDHVMTCPPLTCSHWP
jgi:hypothetical protein